MELILPSSVSGDTRRALRGACEAAPRLNELAVQDAWDAARSRRELAQADYWPDGAPAVLQVRLPECVLRPEAVACFRKLLLLC